MKPIGVPLCTEHSDQFFLVFAGVVFAQRPDEQTGSPDSSPKVVISRPFEAITDTEIVSATGTSIAPNELVIGVAVNGDSRAYPINQLIGPRRESINNRLGERRSLRLDDTSVTTAACTSVNWNRKRMRCGVQESCGGVAW